MKKVTNCIVYKLHKDNSPTVIDCSSEKEQNEQLAKIIKEGYNNAYKATPEQVAATAYRLEKAISLFICKCV